METIKKLPVRIFKNGFEYTQVLRGHRSCIYEQMVCKSKDLKNYEVFIIKIKPSRNLYGTVYPATEIFPHDEAFGYWAWTFRDYDDAKQRFKELEEGKHS